MKTENIYSLLLGKVEQNIYSLLLEKVEQNIFSLAPPYF